MLKISDFSEPQLTYKPDITHPVSFLIKFNKTIILFQMSVFSPDNWAGRFWARTWCNGGSNHCDTGDCGNSYECHGKGGTPPITLAEFTLKGHGGKDFYDISLVDG